MLSMIGMGFVAMGNDIAVYVVFTVIAMLSVGAKPK
jgi:hypothetical protein